MSENVVVFNTLKELLDHVDKELNSARSVLGAILRQIDTQRAKLITIKNVLKDLAKSEETKQETNTIKLEGSEIAFNPSINYEIEALEELAKHLQQKVDTLTSIKKTLSELQDILNEPLEIITYMYDKVPKRIIVKP
ncbi:MAG: hypothetical protein ACXQTI_07365 [Candidatus Nezhaarchaeales archaeon]